MAEDAPPALNELEQAVLANPELAAALDHAKASVDAGNVTVRTRRPRPATSSQD